VRLIAGCGLVTARRARKPNWRGESDGRSFSRQWRWSRTAGRRSGRRDERECAVLSRLTHRSRGGVRERGWMRLPRTAGRLVAGGGRSSQPAGSDRDARA
jgi:hypothetical protein